MTNTQTTSTQTPVVPWMDYVATVQLHDRRVTALVAQGFTEAVAVQAVAIIEALDARPDNRMADPEARGR